MKEFFKYIIESVCGIIGILTALFLLLLTVVGTFLFCTPGGWLILFIILIRWCSG